MKVTKLSILSFVFFVLSSIILCAPCNVYADETFDMTEYMPMVVGNNWSFYNQGDSSTWSNRISGTADFSGETAYEYLDSDENYEYYGFQVDWLKMYGYKKLGVLYTFIEPIDLMPSIVTRGITYSDTTTFIYDGSDATYSIEVQIIGLENVSTLGGAIVKDALHIKITRHIVGVGIDETQIIDNWYDKDIGLVKRIDLIGATSRDLALCGAYTYYNSGNIRAELIPAGGSSGPYDNIITYYESGNVKTYSRENFIYTFIDEDYYGCAQGSPAPGYLYGTGRLLKYEYFDNDDILIDWEQYEYFGDTLNVRKAIEPERGDDAGSTRIEEFYGEERIKNPRFAVDSDGNVLIAAQVYTGTGWRDSLIKKDSSGNVLWVKGHDERNWIRCNLGVLVDGDDNVYVTSHVWNGTEMNLDIIIHKYDKDGNLLGSYQYDSGKEDMFAYISFDLDGNIVIAGGSGFDNESNIFIAKISSDLSMTPTPLLWSRVYDSGILDSIKFFKLEPDGNISVYLYKYDVAGSGGESCHLVYEADGDLIVDELDTGRGDNFTGAHQGSWVVGRSYKDTEVKGDDMLVSESFAYDPVTGISLIGTNDEENPYQPPEFGKMIYYMFADPVTGEEKSAYAEFENGVSAEVNFVSGTYNMFITKINYSEDITYWFMWGDCEYEGAPNHDVAIVKSGDTWTAYNFDPLSVGIEELMGSLTEIGPVADPGSLALPELGSWWQYCADNDIVPEFPPLSSDLTYDSYHYLTQRVDQNPFPMQSTYTYDWDYGSPGRMLMTLSYDYDGDSQDETIYQAIYLNGDDHDIINMRLWETVYQFYGLSGDRYYGDGTPVIYGDANADGIVNDRDASVLGSHWRTQSGANWLDGDFNKDGKVDDKDAAILASHWQDEAGFYEMMAQKSAERNAVSPQDPYVEAKINVK